MRTLFILLLLLVSCVEDQTQPKITPDDQTLDDRVESIPTENKLPTISGLTSQTIKEGENLTLKPIFEDADGDELLVEVEGLPSNSTYENGVLTFTPDHTQSGQYEILFTVSDGEDEVAQLLTITVDDENAAPIIADITSQTMEVNQTITVKVTASDVDGDEITLTADNLPVGSTFVDGDFSWVPSCSQAGDYSIEFTADDGIYTDTKILSLSVTSINCYAPQWKTIPSLVDDEIELQAIVKIGSATDADGDSLTYTYTGLHYDCNNIDWTVSYSNLYNRFTITKPTTTDWGMHHFLVYVEDEGGLRDYRFIQINYEGSGEWNIQVKEQTDVYSTEGLCPNTLYQH